MDWLNGDPQALRCLAGLRKPSELSIRTSLHQRHAIPQPRVDEVIVVEVFGASPGVCCDDSFDLLLGFDPGSLLCVVRVDASLDLVAGIVAMAADDFEAFAGPGAALIPRDPATSLERKAKADRHCVFVCDSEFPSQAIAVSYDVAFPVQRDCPQFCDCPAPALAGFWVASRHRRFELQIPSQVCVLPGVNRRVNRERDFVEFLEMSRDGGRELSC
ncbi:hypothetical protein [Paucibacter sp. XJ19-41]|uniref:hypothetical protein n=1 Tax=Paucibacter sp. XJ19-41 TaxID=2927824 RepID=UPI00234AEA92|nr:hypothetical protein [Paucibacter sp. XJ19-41]MDC6171349.1 hypothetical protein [Paucibacter sp. XJ19-41]